MKIVNYRGVLTAFLVIGLLAASTGIYAQQTVYKWVDEEGVVHFSEEPPGESPEVEVEVLRTDPAPAYVPPARKTTKMPSASEPSAKSQPAQLKTQLPAPVKALDITQISLEELDRRCEEAREKRIAPLRNAEIEQCIETGTGDQAWCETFWADYGDAVRAASGAIIPRMFNDLPECDDAWNERNRRGLYPGGNP
ncbi:MAG: DUF4124 domain-containing protein [Woeseiaceae bacterium]|jgi:hypothetical protein